MDPRSTDCAETVAISASAPPSRRIGEIIGPYRLIHVLGEGGMGQVYQAEQSRPVRRVVAIKLIRPA